MNAHSKSPESHVLVFADDRDPSQEETARVLKQLQPLPAEEVLPGTIRVTGSRRDIERCVTALHHWTLGTEKLFRLNPPHKSLLR